MECMNSTRECALCEKRLSYHSCSLPCNHQFCQICISKWCAHSNLCPTCNKKFTRINEFINNSPTGFIFSAKALAKLYETSNPSDSNHQNSSSFTTESLNFQPAQQCRLEESIEPVERASIQSSRSSIHSPVHHNINSKLTLSTKAKEMKKNSLMPKLVLSSIQV